MKSFFLLFATSITLIFLPPPTESTHKSQQNYWHNENRNFSFFILICVSILFCCYELSNVYYEQPRSHANHACHMIEKNDKSKPKIHNSNHLRLEQINLLLSDMEEEKLKSASYSLVSTTVLFRLASFIPHLEPGTLLWWYINWKVWMAAATNYYV